MYSAGGGGLAARRRKAKKDEIKDDEVSASTDANGTTTTGTGTGADEVKEKPKDEAKTTPALIRIQKDLADLEIPENVELKKEDDMTFAFVIQPTSGYWKGGLFEFKFSFPEKYPFVGPKVSCVDKIYHPNIDLEGGVCVNVLRPWKPTYSTQIVLFGLLFLFTHPNPNDPLNNEAAKEMREQPQNFARNCVNAMKGLRVGTTQFPKNRGKGIV